MILETIVRKKKKKKTLPCQNFRNRSKKKRFLVKSEKTEIRKNAFSPDFKRKEEEKTLPRQISELANTL